MLRRTHSARRETWGILCSSESTANAKTKNKDRARRIGQIGRRPVQLTKQSREKGVGGDEEGEGSKASKDSFVGHW